MHITLWFFAVIIAELTLMVFAYLRGYLAAIADLEADLEFSKKERRTIKHALDYTWHRLNKHEYCGVRGIINEERLATLRNKI